MARKKVDLVVVTCYGESKVWERKDAIHYYSQGAMFCEGSEAERYWNIYGQLINGAKEAYDD